MQFHSPAMGGGGWRGRAVTVGTQAGPHPESSETEVQVQSHSPRKDVCVCMWGGGGGGHGNMRWSSSWIFRDWVMAVAGFAVTSSSSSVSQSQKGCGGGGGGGAWKHELFLLLNLQRLSYGSSRLCCYFIFKFSLTVPQGEKLVRLLHTELPL